MSRRLITNSCELGLLIQPEVFSEKPHRPEKSFAGLIAKEKNWDFTHIGMEHASNEYICRSTTDWLLENKLAKQQTCEDIFFLISWTQSCRREYYWEKTSETKQINWPNLKQIFSPYWPESTNKIVGHAHEFWQLHKEYATNNILDYNHMLQQILTLQSLFESHNISYLFLSSFTLDENIESDLWHAISAKNRESLLDPKLNFQYFCEQNNYKIGPMGIYPAEAHNQYSQEISKYVDASI